MDSSVLYAQIVVDKPAIARHIRHALQDHSQVSLRELCEERPLTHGLAELIAYLEMGQQNAGGERFSMLIDEDVEDTISWTTQQRTERRASMPRIIYMRPTASRQSRT